MSDAQLRSDTQIRVLVVEDEALLAMDLEMLIEDAGHAVAGAAASLRAVAALPDATQPDLAFVDLHLAEGSSGLDVCALLQQRWPEATIVFLTANPSKIPEDCAGASGIIGKPFSRNGLIGALHYLAEGVLDPPPNSPRPSAFLASPACRAAWG